MAVPRTAMRLAKSFPRASSMASRIRTFSAACSRSNKDQLTNPPQGNPVVSDRGPPTPPKEEASRLKDNQKAATYLGTTKRLPEFQLNDKVILVTGAARGLGLTQAEGLLEAGATGMFFVHSMPQHACRTSHGRANHT